MKVTVFLPLKLQKYLGQKEFSVKEVNEYLEFFHYSA